MDVKLSRALVGLNLNFTSFLPGIFFFFFLPGNHFCLKNFTTSHLDFSFFLLSFFSPKRGLSSSTLPSNIWLGHRLSTESAGMTKSYRWRENWCWKGLFQQQYKTLSTRRKFSKANLFCPNIFVLTKTIKIQKKMFPSGYIFSKENITFSPARWWTTQLFHLRMDSFPYSIVDGSIMKYTLSPTTWQRALRIIAIFGGKEQLGRGRNQVG